MQRKLTLGCAFSDRIEALADGRVTISGYDLDVRLKAPPALFADALGPATYDLVEMSLGTHVAALNAGRREYTALPIFLSRAFRHSNIYVHDLANIASPQDLIGKRIGISDYAQTAGIWVRGILAEHYGVSRDSVQWISGGLHQPTSSRLSVKVPSNVNLTHTESTLNTMLADGEIDALVSPIAPNCFVRAEAKVSRLFENYRETEINYYNRTRVFPVMHCLVARTSLLEADPELTRLLSDAFGMALTLALADLEARDYAKVTIPWLVKYHEETVGWLGDPLWTYGIQDNRSTLEAFLKFAAADGLCRTDMDLSELFAA